MKKIIIVGLALILAVAGIGCLEEEETEKLEIITTTTMLTDLVENIGGEKVNVEGLMGPGIDPHQYQASAGDIEKMQEADLIIYNGLHLEGKLADVLAEVEQEGTETIAVAEEVPEEKLLAPEEAAGHYDGHIWSDVKLWKEAVTVVKEALVEANPEATDNYKERAKEYQAELVELEEYVRSQIEKLPPEDRVLVTAHDAFNYFGEAYDFEVKAIQGITTTTEPGTGDIEELAQYIADNEVPAIFVETSVPEQNIKALQEAVKAKGFAVEVGGELYSDALGDPDTETGTYIGMTRDNVDTIVGALTEKEDTR